MVYRILSSHSKQRGLCNVGKQKCLNNVEWENGKEYPEKDREEVQVGRRAGQCMRPSHIALREHTEE